MKQFGAEKHKYQWSPPACLKEVEKFERETVISLPDGYRNFLLQAGNGGAGPFYGLFSLAQVKGWLSWQVEPGKSRIWPREPIRIVTVHGFAVHSNMMHTK